MKEPKKRKIFQKRAKRLNAIRKLKRLAKERSKKPSSVSKDIFVKKSDKFMNMVLAAKEIEGYCPHFLVGSSSVLSFLQGGHSYKNAHSYMFTTIEARFIGQAGEEAFKRTRPQIVQFHPFVISRQNPWICATPDFLVLKDGVKMLVEVKTFSDISDAINFFKTIPKRTIIQVWLGMELLGVQDGRIQIYVLDKVARIVTLCGVIKLKRTATFFNRYLWAVSCLQYVRFLDEYLQEQGVTPCADYFDTLALRLVSRFDGKIFQEAETGNLPRKYSIERPLQFHCPYFEGTVKDEDLNNQIRPPFPQLFAPFRFTSTSKKVHNEILDEEARTEIVQLVQNKLSHADKEKIDDLILKSQGKGTTTKLLSSKMKEKLTNIEIRSQKTKEKTIEDKLHTFEEEMKKMKAELTATKAQNEELLEMFAQLQKKKQSAKRSQSRRTRKTRLRKLQSIQQEKLCQNISSGRTTTEATRYK